MAGLYALCLLLIVSSVFVNITAKSTRPNIVFIIADDLGWDDVSFHGSNQILTPNIDLLAYTGVAFDRYYSHCICTPSRAALLTGKFAHTTGMHGYPLTNGEDRGLPVSEKILPEYLKDLGYATHLVGKWHLGQSRNAYLPTSRGFDSHFGFRGGYIDYYEYLNEETWPHGKVAGFDLHRNLTPAWDVEGYITHIFTDEAKSIIKVHNESVPLFLMMSYSAPHGGTEGAVLQAPPETVRSMRYVELPRRRMYSAMMKELDEGVGDIVKALSDKGILDNTIIVFVSDNGGMPVGNSINYASNWPLRGMKFSPFEGGIRVPALLWTSSLTSTSHLWKGYMHIVDWLPTLLRAANAKTPLHIDGVDLWNKILTDQASTRSEFFEIYTYGETSYCSVISGNYKLVTGNVTKQYSDSLGRDVRGIIGSGPSYTDAIKTSTVYSVLQKMEKPFKMENIALRNNTRIYCKSTEHTERICYADKNTMCLYNIMDDPCETRDLSKLRPDILVRLLARLQAEMSRTIDRPYPLFRDPRALPSLHNYTWTTWADDI